MSLNLLMRSPTAGGGNYIPMPPLLATPLYIHDGNVCDYNHHDDNYYGGGDDDAENRLSMMTNHFDS